MFTGQRVVPPVRVGSRVEIHEVMAVRWMDSAPVSKRFAQVHFDDFHPLVITDPLQFPQTVFVLLSVLLVHASPFHPQPCPTNLRVLSTPTRNPKSGAEPSRALPSTLLCLKQAREGLETRRRA